MPSLTQTQSIDALLHLLALLDIKSAQRLLARRNSINSMVGALKELYHPVMMYNLVPDA